MKPIAYLNIALIGSIVCMLCLMLCDFTYPCMEQYYKLIPVFGVLSSSVVYIGINWRKC